VIARRFAFTALAVAVFAAAPLPVPLPLASPVATNEAAILARYATLVAKASSAPFVSFDYTVEQVGLRDFQQVHRIYRDKSNERDELTIVNDELLPRPVVRLYRRKPERYSVGRVAPRAPAYAFRYLAPARNGKHAAYVFATIPKVAGRFRVDRVTIDGVTAMPTQLQFTTKSGAVVGRGTIEFMKVDRYYVPSAVTVHATVDGQETRERIVWTHYRFPKSLPSNVFTPPRRLPANEPVVPVGL
jgi:hypothetical protein